MHEGFVDVNAGTLGTSMIEGRAGAGGEAGFRVTADTGCPRATDVWRRPASSPAHDDVLYGATA